MVRAPGRVLRHLGRGSLRNQRPEGVANLAADDVMVGVVADADDARAFATGALDHRRSPLAYPWPPLITVEAVAP